MPRLKFIERVHEHDDIYSFHFEKPTGFHYKAGQHGVFFAGWHRPHPFSLTSAPHEPTVSFATKIRQQSRFKQKLMSLKPGDSVFFIGPLTNFTFDTRYHRHVFLAQGIGITPVHSMLLHAAETKMNDEITLLHVSKDTPTFQSLTSSLSTTSHYLTSSKDYHHTLKDCDPSSKFYISGSPAFIRSTKKQLHSAGVKNSQITADLFLGY